MDTISAGREITRQEWDAMVGEVAGACARRRAELAPDAKILTWPASDPPEPDDAA